MVLVPTDGKVLHNVLCSWRGNDAAKVLLFLCNKLPLRVGKSEGVDLVYMLPTSRGVSLVPFTASSSHSHTFTLLL